LIYSGIAEYLRSRFIGGLLRPVFDGQVLHPLKVFDVVRDKDEVVMNRRGADQQVEVVLSQAEFFEPCLLGREHVEHRENRHDFELGAKRIGFIPIFFRSVAFGRTIFEFRNSNFRKTKIGHSNFIDPSENLDRASHKIDRNIRIQKILTHKLPLIKIHPVQVGGS
jgi:hypothetical protein